MTTGPLIGTHNGRFHADEALAFHLLRLLPEYKSSPVVRSRDPAVLSRCHTVIDIGGEYCPSSNRYDHHQRSFNTTFPTHSIKLSSAGLVYMHFGQRIISLKTGLNITSPEVELLWRKLYDNKIEAFDANDNGVSVYDTDSLLKANISKRFDDHGFSIASAVNNFNTSHFSPPATSAIAVTETADQADEDARFLYASEFVGTQFEISLAKLHKDWLPARPLVRDAYASRREHHHSGQIVVLPYRRDGIPWIDHLYEIEHENPDEPQILYVLYSETAAADSRWRVQAVPSKAASFDNRKSLPLSWCGLRDDKLSSVSDIPDCIFVHANGFTGANNTFTGALNMASKAVNM